MSCGKTVRFDGYNNAPHEPSVGVSKSARSPGASSARSSNHDCVTVMAACAKKPPADAVMVPAPHRVPSLVNTPVDERSPSARLPRVQSASTSVTDWSLQVARATKEAVTGWPLSERSSADGGSIASAIISGALLDDDGPEDAVALEDCVSSEDEDGAREDAIALELGNADEAPALDDARTADELFPDVAPHPVQASKPEPSTRHAWVPAPAPPPHAHACTVPGAHTAPPEELDDVDSPTPGWMHDEDTHARSTHTGMGSFMRVA